MDSQKAVCRTASQVGFFQRVRLISAPAKDLKCQAANPTFPGSKVVRSLLTDARSAVSSQIVDSQAWCQAPLGVGCPLPVIALIPANPCKTQPLRPFNPDSKIVVTTTRSLSISRPRVSSGFCRSCLVRASGLRAFPGLIISGAAQHPDLAAISHTVHQGGKPSAASRTGVHRAERTCPSKETPNPRIRNSSPDLCCANHCFDLFPNTGRPTCR